MVERNMYDWVYIYEFEGDLRARIPAVKEDEDYIGFWKEGHYSYLFFQKDKKAVLRQFLPPFRSETVMRHEDWEAGQRVDVLDLGRITVYPPWKIPSDHEGIGICIDPGMAFGSGYHASTKGALILLERLYRQFIPPTVLDLGTGTGILSIAALKMGTRTAYGLDYNNLAVETARRNRALNDLGTRMHLWMGDARDFLYLKTDLLIANLYLQVLEELLIREDFYSRPYYLLSGLLGHESHRLREKLEGRLTLLDHCQENFWFSFLYQNPSSERSAR
jgi:ribosomal protein L11 methyltransferase